MKIADLLYRDISQRIEPVVKVYDRESLAQDLEQFVITDSLAKELRKFLDAFTWSLQERIRGSRPSDAIGAWIYGFFGSGKSHVAKVLGHVLANETVRHAPDSTAIELFLRHLDDPTLPDANDLKALLQQIREKAYCLLIPFEIKSRQDQTNPESVTETCLRSFYRTLGLSETPWVARLERRLQTDGKYDSFCATYREQNLRDWTEDRQEHGYYLSELQAALATSLGKPVEEIGKMLDTYQRDHAGVTPEQLATEIAQYVDATADRVKPRLPHVIFVIDEMGQFIGDSEDRIHELQSIVEQAGAIGQGKIWFICTSQEALEQVVDRTGLRLNQLGKLDARFDIKIPLTGEDVHRVVRDRLLRKREAQLPVLNSLFEEKEGLIEVLCSLPIERRFAEVNQGSFSDSYPFLPHTIPLVQELFNAMRGFKLSGTERSMIGVAQGALRMLGDQEVGRLVSLDLVFDQQTDELSTSDYLGTAGMQFIHEIDRQIQHQPISPSRVLKALWLISKKADWIPRTPEVLTKLLADSLDTDTVRLRNDIEQCLDALRRAGIVTRDEATCQYRYLSEQERTFEQQIADEISRYGIGTAKRRASQLLKEKVLTRIALADYHIHLGRMRIPLSYSLKLDGEPLHSGGELEIRLFSPLSRAKVEDLHSENLAHGARGKTVWWNAAEDSGLIETLKRLEALDKVPQKARWRTDRSDQTQAILREKQKERDALQRHTVERLRSALCMGTIYYAGEEVALDGEKSLSEIAQEFLEVVASHHCTQLEPSDVQFDDTNIASYLNKERSRLHELDPELNLFNASGEIMRHNPLIEAIFDEIRRRQDENESLDGKALTEHFQRIPFCWPEALVRLVLAAMLRGESITVQPKAADRPLQNPTDPRMGAVFKTLSQFRKATFRAVVGALSPVEVKQTKEKLIQLGVPNPPEYAHMLADKIRATGERLLQQSRRMEQHATDLNLPLPIPATQKITQVLDEHDSVTLVRQFIVSFAKWNELYMLLQNYDQFVENGRDREFQAYADIYGIAHDTPALAKETQPGVPKALEEFGAIVEQRAILTKWKSLCEAARTVAERLATLYREQQSECAEEIGAFREELESLPEYLALDEETRARVLKPYFQSGGLLCIPEIGADELNAEGLLNAYRRANLMQLEFMVRSIPSYRRDILAALEAAVSEATGDEAVDKRPVHRVHLRERLIGQRFQDKESFEKEWSKIGDEIASKLDEGGEVVIDE